MAHQIKDEKQEYQYGSGFTTPSGHEFQYYDTPDNQRLILKHASGSHIEFKADGSIIVKSLKDLHMHSSIVSSANDGQAGASGGSDVTTNFIGTNYTIDVQGALKIKARSIQIEGHDTVHVLAGTDLEMKASNTWVRAKEQVAIEGTASLRMDSDECTQAFRTLRQDIGTEDGEEGKKGGLHKISNHGTFIIEQTDETAAMTIRSKGYLNLVAGQERSDWIGKYTEKPHKDATKKATFYQHVYKPEQLDKNANCKEKPGSYYFENDAGASWMLGQMTKGSCEHPMDGRHVEIQQGDDVLIVHQGDKKEDLLMGDHEETMMQGDKTLTMMQGDREYTQAQGDKKELINGNNQLTLTGAYDQIIGNGIKQIVGNSKLEQIISGMSGGGSFYGGAEVLMDDVGNVNLDCSIYQCPLPEVDQNIIPSIPNILPENDSANGENGGGGGGSGGGGGGGGGMPSLPIGTLLQLLMGNFQNDAAMLNMQKASKIFLN